MQPHIARAIDLAHTARSEEGLDTIRPQVCTDGERSRRVKDLSHDLESPTWSSVAHHTRRGYAGTNSTASGRGPQQTLIDEPEERELVPSPRPPGHGRADGGCVLEATRDVRRFLETKPRAEIGRARLSVASRELGQREEI